MYTTRFEPHLTRRPPLAGSISRAIDISSEIFQPRFVSLVVVAPGLGRYSAFGNLFARTGVGSQGEIHRLDRHPSMSKHPVTPSDESDIKSEIQSITSRLYGTALGKIVRSAAAQTSVSRLVIAGGDTSSIVARTIGIEAVEMITPISPGAPLGRAFAPGSPVDGLEIVFKGGQVGGEDYFGLVLRGAL